MEDTENVETGTENEVDTTVDPGPEKPEAVEKTEKDTVKEERVVPLAALHEERERRKELDKRLRESDEKRAKMEARFEEWQKRQDAPKQEAEPDFDADPGAWLRYQTEKQGKAVESTTKSVEELRQQQAQHSEQSEFTMRVATTVEQFKAKTADYMDAYKFWLNSVAEEVTDAMGYEDPVAVAREVANFERAIAVKAMQDGKNPGERLYAAAKRRGFKAANGAAEKVDQINKGQKASSPMSQAGGRAEGRLTLESLAEMSDDEFGKLSEAQWRKAMGG